MIFSSLGRVRAGPRDIWGMDRYRQRAREERGVEAGDVVQPRGAEQEDSFPCAAESLNGCGSRPYPALQSSVGDSGFSRVTVFQEDVGNIVRLSRSPRLKHLDQCSRHCDLIPT